LGEGRRKGGGKEGGERGKGEEEEREGKGREGVRVGPRNGRPGFATVQDRAIVTTADQ